MIWYGMICVNTYLNKEILIPYAIFKMALLKPLEDQQEALKSDIDLTLCEICLTPIKNPKALPVYIHSVLHVLENGLDGKQKK